MNWTIIGAIYLAGFLLTYVFLIHTHRRVPHVPAPRMRQVLRLVAICLLGWWLIVLSLLAVWISFMLFRRR